MPAYPAQSPTHGVWIPAGAGMTESYPVGVVSLCGRTRTAPQFILLEAPIDGHWPAPKKDIYRRGSPPLYPLDGVHRSRPVRGLSDAAVRVAHRNSLGMDARHVARY